MNMSAGLLNSLVDPPSPSNMEFNMEATDSFSVCAMDDPITPLCIPVCNSFDQEFQFQENIHLNMLPQNNTLKSGGTADESQVMNGPHESIELPLDLFDFLENAPINIEGLIQDSIYHDALTSNADSRQSNRRTAPISDVQSHELAIQTHEFIQPHIIAEHENEDIVSKFEEMYSLLPELVTSYGNIQRGSATQRLRLDLETAMPPNPSEDVTTPALIEMLLESECVDQEHKTVELPTDFPPLTSILPKAIEEMSSNCDSAADISLPPTPIARTRTAGRKRASTTVPTHSDLRRVRNNEASRKSRQNRRKKQQTQAQLVDVLEEEGRRLVNKIKELEDLKAEMMKYMTRNKTIPS